MDFDLSDEQRLLKDSVDRLRGGPLRLRSPPRQPGRTRRLVARPTWSQMAELGLLGLPFSEDDGGFGGGPTETAIVMEAFGRSASSSSPTSPPPSSAPLCCGTAPTPEQRARLVPEIAAGDRVLAYAQIERQSRYSLNDVKNHAATRTGQTDEWIDHLAAKSLVLNGDTADLPVW